MILHGIPDADLRNGDTLAEPLHVDGGELMRFDRVITNPPFSQNYSAEGIPFADRFRYGFCPESGKKADLMFVRHMVSVLRAGGGKRGLTAFSLSSTGPPIQRSIWCRITLGSAGNRSSRSSTTTSAQIKSWPRQDKPIRLLATREHLKMGHRGRLDRIKVEGFKSIERLDLRLKDLNILVGANGAGKSNFIGLFKFIHEIRRKNLQFFVSQQLGADKLLFFGRKRTSVLDIYLEFEPNAYTASLAPDAGGGLLFQREYCHSFGDKINNLGGTKKYHLASPGARESGLPDQSHTASAAGHVVGYLSDWKVYHFHDTSESAKVKQPGRIRETDILLPNADNLSAFLRSIRETSAYKLIVRTIQRVAPFFLDFVLEPEADNPAQIRLRWRHRGSEETFDASGSIPG